MHNSRNYFDDLCMSLQYRNSTFKLELKYALKINKIIKIYALQLSIILIY